ncbi:serine/threonine-protein kinase ATG1a [Selaginella moellendorffii]|uniref:serine/threonine-protein kinase ATG1a n=1 Tax=Selaginella moellendorffii TaxID=88036 RepID=UPI000D1CBD13|nr:serine/threonine-protein kinase ATG1a [Selaginella moellendorffii]|eukprot:XP_024515852.1 serine/threonine-protein kinase ATG1a [Selaginella moellendorffii]
MQTRERSESSYGFLCNIKSLYLKRDEQVHFSPIKEIMRQLLVGLASLPERDLVDQDVQPACIRHSNFLVKLGDFQSARGLSTPPKPEVTGSLGYRALEVISGEAEKMVWGAGVVFALMLLGENPFDLSWDKWRAIVSIRFHDMLVPEYEVAMYSPVNDATTSHEE